MQQHNKVYAKKKITFCFGTGREAMKSVTRTKPGPETYTDHSEDLGVNSRKSTLHGRNFYLDDGSLAIKRGVPGPGTYD